MRLTYMSPCRPNMIYRESLQSSFKHVTDPILCSVLESPSSPADAISKAGMETSGGGKPKGANEVPAYSVKFSSLR